MKKLLFSALFAVSCLTLFGQGTFLPLNSYSYHFIDRLDIKYGKILPVSHTSTKPYSRKWLAAYIDTMAQSNIVGDTQFNYNLRYQYLENSEWHDTTILSLKPTLKYFYKDPANLISIDADDFILKLNPVFHFYQGAQQGSRFINTRGLELRGYISKKVGFYTYLAETQMRGMKYVKSKIDNEDAIPGEGYWKYYRPNNFGSKVGPQAIDFLTARGYVVVNLIKHIDVELGHGKNFIGNGIRSLILSDYSNNYFYTKLQTRIWRITYTNLYTELTGTYTRGLDQLLPKKYGTFHHLNIAFSKAVNVGLFEGIIFDRDRYFEFHYLNPIIFYRSIEQDVGSPDNAVIGIDYKVNFLRRFSVYGQVMLDEFNFKEVTSGKGWWANKHGIQIGGKYIDVGNIENLDLQVEYNSVRPYTYTHNTLMSSYTHYNQPLAHPLGANFREFIGIANYQIIPELEARLTVMYTQQGLDTAGTNYGSNVFVPNVDEDQVLTVENQYGNKLLQGPNLNVLMYDFLLSYQIRHNVFFDLNFIIRNTDSSIQSWEDSQVSIGIGARMNIPYRTHWF